MLCKITNIIVIILTSANCSYARNFTACGYLEYLLENGRYQLRSKKDELSSYFKMNNLFFRSVKVKVT